MTSVSSITAAVLIAVCFDFYNCKAPPSLISEPISFNDHLCKFFRVTQRNNIFYAVG